MRALLTLGHPSHHHRNNFTGASASSSALRAGAATWTVTSSGSITTRRDAGIGRWIVRVTHRPARARVATLDQFTYEVGPRSHSISPMAAWLAGAPRSPSPARASTRGQRRQLRFFARRVLTTIGSSSQITATSPAVSARGHGGHKGDHAARPECPDGARPVHPMRAGPRSARQPRAGLRREVPRSPSRDQLHRCQRRLLRHYRRRPVFSVN